MIAIRCGGELSPSLQASLKLIFFLTAAKQSFDSQNEREQFFSTWLGDYLAFYPDSFCRAYGPHGELIGYLAGYIPRVSEGQPMLTLPYQDDLVPYLTSYPAHFHLNIHPAYQRQGVGPQLFTYFWQKLLQADIAGVHVVTANSATNFNFYQKIGLVDCHPIAWGGGELTLLGRKI